MESKYKEFFEYYDKLTWDGLKLTEVSINRIRKHGEKGFIVISTNRSSVESSNPNNDLSEEYENYCKSHSVYASEKTKEDFLKWRNNQCDAELLFYLRSKENPYSFTPVFGGYHGTDDVVDSYEPSFIVYSETKKGVDGSWEDLKDKAIEWCRKYKQDSVYVQAPNEAPVYLDCNGDKVNSEESSNFKYNRDDEMFYTTTDRKKHSPDRFTADIRFPENLRVRSKPSSYNEKVKRSGLGEIWDLF